MRSCVTALKLCSTGVAFHSATAPVTTSSSAINAKPRARRVAIFMSFMGGLK